MLAFLSSRQHTVSEFKFGEVAFLQENGLVLTDIDAFMCYSLQQRIYLPSAHFSVSPVSGLQEVFLGVYVRGYQIAQNVGVTVQVYSDSTGQLDQCGFVCGSGATACSQRANFVQCAQSDGLVRPSCAQPQLSLSSPSAVLQVSLGAQSWQFVALNLSQAKDFQLELVSTDAAALAPAVGVSSLNSSISLFGFPNEFEQYQVLQLDGSGDSVFAQSTTQNLLGLFNPGAAPLSLQLHMYQGKTASGGDLPRGASTPTTLYLIIFLSLGGFVLLMFLLYYWSRYRYNQQTQVRDLQTEMHALNAAATAAAYPQYNKKRREDVLSNPLYEQLNPARLFRSTNSCEAVQCVICLDDIRKKQSYRKMLCGHNYHTECIDKWMKNNDSCPHCRQKINQKAFKEHQIRLQRCSTQDTLQVNARQKKSARADTSLNNDHRPLDSTLNQPHLSTQSRMITVPNYANVL